MNQPDDLPAVASPQLAALTVASTWMAASGTGVGDDLLRWPPDIFAFTDLVIDRSEAYRFVVSPPADRQWPPLRAAQWSGVIAAAADQWCQWIEGLRSTPPDLIAQEWDVVRQATATPIDDVATGHEWRLCEALLTLHAVADQACAEPPTSAIPAEDAGIGCRAKRRELLARTGSMARVEPELLRVLPKYRTPFGGITSRSISRHACLVGPGVDVSVHKISSRPADPQPQPLNMLLLPWPLHVSTSDFHPMLESIQEREIEPYGYFAFQPSHSFDLSLTDRLLAEASKYADRVDIVVLPEDSLLQQDLPGLEALLSRHGVGMLVAGLGTGVRDGGAFTSNWVHFGASIDGRWWHYRQDKHHRWSLEQSQIEQYHLEDVLDPRVRWWEAMEVRRRSLQLMERGDGLLIGSLICEDLAHIDEVIEGIRAVGPALIFSLLLDGPQLQSRWTARYASVLADDPGSAVLTLSSYGMVRRAWGGHHPPSSVVALWKDPTHRMQEITLDDGAQGILLAAECSHAIRRAADGRSPELTVGDLTIGNITQLHVDDTAVATTPIGESPEAAGPPPLSPAELSVVLAWSDAIAASASAPDHLAAILADARPGASWRARLNLPPPTAPLEAALDTLADRVTGGDDDGLVESVVSSVVGPEPPPV